MGNKHSGSGGTSPEQNQVNRRRFLTQLSLGLGAASAVGAGYFYLSDEPEPPAAETPAWRKLENPKDRLEGMAVYVRETLTKELEAAKKSGKIPLVLVGEHHLSHLSYMTENLIGLTLADLLKQSDPRKRVAICLEGGSNESKAQPSDEMLKKSDVKERLAKKEDLLFQRSSSVIWESLIDSFSRRGIAPNHLYLGPLEPLSPTTPYVQMNSGQAFPPINTEGFIDAYSKESGRLEDVAVKRLVDNFGGQTNQVPMAVFGGMHLRAMSKMLKDTGRFHVITFNTHLLSRESLSTNKDLRDVSGNLILGKKLVPISTPIQGGIRLGDMMFRPGEPFVVKPAYSEEKYNFLLSSAVHSLSTGLRYNNDLTLELAEQRAEELADFARQKLQASQRQP